MISWYSWKLRRWKDTERYNITHLPHDSPWFTSRLEHAPLAKLFAAGATSQSLVSDTPWIEMSEKWWRRLCAHSQMISWFVTMCSPGSVDDIVSQYPLCANFVVQGSKEKKCVASRRFTPFPGGIWLSKYRLVRQIICCSHLSWPRQSSICQI